MQNNKLSIITLMCLVCCLGFLNPLQAQFKKYQSRTDLAEKKAKELQNHKGGKAENIDKVKNADASASDDNQDVSAGASPEKRSGAEEAMFGRSDEKAYADLPEKSKKFVNLNPETAFGPEVVTNFDFVDVDILELTKHMKKLTGLNLIWDNDIKGKVNISAEAPITVGSAWKAYLAALNMRGFTLVQSGDFYKIIQSRDVQYYPTKIYENNYTPDTDNYVMRILKLKYVNSSEINRSFKPFMTRYGRIEEIKQTNDLIIVDTGTNINRLVKLIKFIDVPGHEESLQIIAVKNTTAQEIVNLLDKIMKGQSSSRFGARSYGAGGGSTAQKYDITKLIAEPRTNAIIAMTNAEGAAQLRSLVDKLDVQMVSKGGGQIQVYYLMHAESETMSKTLSTLISSAASTQPGGRPSYSFRSNADSMPPLFNSEVKITSDKANNALVVMASPTDYITIKGIIAKLDIPRDQVYVEGLIMDTTIRDSNNFGINILGAYGTGAVERFALAPDGTSGVAGLMGNKLETLGSLTGLFAGAGFGPKRSLTINGQQTTVSTVNAVIQAIATNSNTNVLATPQILALDNEDAEFEVGSKVPTSQREVANNGAVMTSEKRESVTTKLTITPQINKKSHNVRLKIKLKVEDFSEDSPSGVSGLITTVREANTSVIVRDRDTIAMGGLMRDRKTDTEKGVPLLKDIPVLGWLFKSKVKVVEKVNMLLFMTPRIVAPYDKESADTMKDLLERRKAHLGDDAKGGEFDATSKALYQKADKQKAGPLYDPSSSKELEDNEKGSGTNANGDTNTSSANLKNNDNDNENSAPKIVPLAEEAPVEVPTVQVEPKLPETTQPSSSSATVRPDIEAVPEDGGTVPNYQEIFNKAQKNKADGGEQRSENT